MTLLLIAAAALAGTLEHQKQRDPVDKILVAPPPVHWLKNYAVAPFREFWSARLTVKDLDESLPKVVAGLERAGAEMTQKMAAFISSPSGRVQQLSFRVPAKKADKVLKAARKLGRLTGPDVRPSLDAVTLDEVRAKRAALDADRKARAAELATMPAVSAVADELAAQLRAAESALLKRDEQLLLNLTIEGQP